MERREFLAASLVAPLAAQAVPPVVRDDRPRRPSRKRFLVLEGAMPLEPDAPSPTSWVDVPDGHHVRCCFAGTPGEAVTREEALAAVAEANRAAVAAAGGDLAFVDWSVVVELGESKRCHEFEVDSSRGVLRVEMETPIAVVVPTAAERRRHLVAVCKFESAGV